MNRRLELLYRETEWLGVVNSLNNNDWSTYPASNLKLGWRTILRHQFHDIIPGSSITEVYEDTKVEYKEQKEIALKEQENFNKNLVKENKNSFTIINNANWNRNEIVEIESNLEGNFYDENNNKLNSQKVANKYFVELNDVNSLGFKTITLKEENIEKRKL